MWTEPSEAAQAGHLKLQVQDTLIKAQQDYAFFGVVTEDNLPEGKFFFSRRPGCGLTVGCIWLIAVRFLSVRVLQK